MPRQTRPSAILLMLGLVWMAVSAAPARAVQIFYVSPQGNDSAVGTDAAPFQTLGRARDAVRQWKKQSGLPAGGIQVILHGGTYYLGHTLIFQSEDSGTANSPIVYLSAPGETVILSGATKLDLHWTPYKNGIFQASVPGKFTFDQLFIDGQLQHLARYPNYNPNAVYFNGYAADAISPQRIKAWSDPTTGILHALHDHEWGDMSYRITGVDHNGNATLSGGWQNNRPSPPHPSIRFVENIFEELDAPGEWFLNQKTGVLFFMPPSGVDLSKARVEAAGLKCLIQFHGSHDAPVRFISFRGISFMHSARTFLEKYEPLLRSDWCIYRGGAVLYDGAEDCAIVDSDFRFLGGNALFISRYNRRISISGCLFTDVGASTICFVGDPGAARFAASGLKAVGGLDRTPGPKTDNYPADCHVSDCLMHHFGTVEKQVAGVELSMSERITVSHCSIFDCPRAGINIGDGCWGGDVIEFCDVFDTVKETGDHGSFNGWGRDRYWHSPNLEESVRQNPNFPKLDTLEPNILRNSRWRCDHGWDIDLDDGCTNYHIYNNLCLYGGIKNREGYFRVVENNIVLDNTFHPHVWFANSQDIVRHNIFQAAYMPAPSKLSHWGLEVDSNLFPTSQALQQVQSRYGVDKHSAAGEAKFLDPAHGDYRVADDSPALRIGFKNFPMDQFGVVSPRLKAQSKTPQLVNDPSARKNVSAAELRLHKWLGGSVRSITGLSDRSAFGLPGETGVLILDVPAKGPLANFGLKPNDVILALGDKPIAAYADLVTAYKQLSRGGRAELLVVRDQNEIKIAIQGGN